MNEARSDLEVHFSLTSLLYFSLSFLIFSKKSFWPCHKAFGILIPRPGVKVMPPAVEAQSIIPLEPQEISTSSINERLKENDIS